jgi:hypothetical protein
MAHHGVFEFDADVNRDADGVSTVFFARGRRHIPVALHGHAAEGSPQVMSWQKASDALERGHGRGHGTEMEKPGQRVAIQVARHRAAEEQRHDAGRESDIPGSIGHRVIERLDTEAIARQE